MPEEKQVGKVNPVTALTQRISAARDMKDLLSIDVVKDRYIKNYQLGTGRADGASRYERDMLAFQEKVNNNTELMNCDPFSIFAVFVKVATWGVHPDKIYLQPQGVKQKDGSYKQIMKVSLDPFGKKEVLERMDTIIRINDPVLVFKEDTFRYDPKRKNVATHDQKWPTPNPSEDTVIAVYCTVDFKDGVSRDYILSLEELKKRRAASKMKDGGALWITHYGEAAKKSVINYIYKAEYKAPETQAMFPKYEDAVEVHDEEEEQTTTQAVEAVPDFNPAVNEQTGQVYEPTEEAVKKEKPQRPNFMED